MEEYFKRQIRRSKKIELTTGECNLIDNNGIIRKAYIYESKPAYFKTIPKCPGTYSLIDNNGKVVKVGSSRNLHEKFRHHKRYHYNFTCISPKFSFEILSIKDKPHLKENIEFFYRRFKENWNLRRKKPYCYVDKGHFFAVKSRYFQVFEFFNLVFYTYRYIIESNYLKTLSKNEINKKKNKLIVLFENLNIPVNRMEEILKLYKEIQISPNIANFPKNYNLLDLIIKEERWLIKPEELKYFLLKSKELKSENFTFELYKDDNNELFIVPNFNNTNSKEIEDYLGSTL